MQLHEYLATLRRRWGSFVATLVICGVLAVVYLQVLDPTYVARSQLFVAPGSAPDSQILASGGAFYRDRVKTYAYLVDNDIVLDQVREVLDLDESTLSLAERVTATVPADTVLLTIEVADASPEQAALIANTIADVFQVVITDLETSSASGPPVVGVEIVQHAVAPSSPSGPGTIPVVALATIVGLCLGIAVAVARELLSRDIETPSDIASVTTLPVLGGLPPLQGKRWGPISGRSAEAVRLLRTNLLALGLGQSDSILVASPNSGEGRSTVAFSLALAAAESGLSVCLVDADLRHSEITTALGFEDEVGLTSVLSGDLETGDAVKTSEHRGVDLLASGPPHHDPSHLLSNGVIAEVTMELESLYDFTIFDSPAVLDVADAAIVGRHASGTILVVSGGPDPVTRSQLAQAIQTLSSASINVLGLVLNRQSSTPSSPARVSR